MVVVVVAVDVFNVVLVFVGVVLLLVTVLGWGRW